MTINWALFCSALVLLWIPQVLPSETSKRLWSGSTRSQHATVAGLLCYPFNWLNLLGAAAGAYLLNEWAITFDSRIEGAGSRAFFLKAAVLGVGLLFQMIRVKRRLILLAPVAYVSGVALALPAFSTGAFAVAVGWVFAAVAKNPMLIIPVMAMGLGAAGYLMDGLSLDLMFTTSLVFAPLILAFIFQKRLVFVTGPQPGSLDRPKMAPVAEPKEAGNAEGRMPNAESQRSRKVRDL